LDEERSSKARRGKLKTKREVLEMFCYLTNCDSNLSKFDAAAREDCVLQHLIVVRREIEKIYDHYLGERGIALDLDLLTNFHEFPQL
jgi:hypothetical protein